MFQNVCCYLTRCEQNQIKNEKNLMERKEERGWFNDSCSDKVPDIQKKFGMVSQPIPQFVVP